MDFMNEREPGRSTIDPAVLLAFMTLFFPRQDIHAKQRPNGRYWSYKEPVTPDLVKAHLAGEVTLGTYALSQESQAFWAVIDADREEDWRQLLVQVAELAMPVYLEQSRRGGHAWVFFEQPVQGCDALAFGKALVKRLGIENPAIEVFPKQARLVDDGPGQLIRLPFGFHRKVKIPGQPGKRFHFQTPNGEPLAPTIRDQLALLAYAERIPHSIFEDLRQEVPAEEVMPLPSPTHAFKLREVDPQLPLSERIKQAVSVKDFVSRYVELDGQGTGFCPFHDDQNPSFGVNEARNYWACFARCCEPSGGSVIDFWSHYRERVQGKDGSFTATVADLAQLLDL